MRPRKRRQTLPQRAWAHEVIVAGGATTEHDVAQAMLQWVAGLGWSCAEGPDILLPDSRMPGAELARGQRLARERPVARAGAATAAE